MGSRAWVAEAVRYPVCSSDTTSPSLGSREQYRAEQRGLPASLKTGAHFTGVRMRALRIVPVRDPANDTTGCYRSKLLSLGWLGFLLALEFWMAELEAFGEWDELEAFRKELIHYKRRRSAHLKRVKAREMAA